MGQVKIAFSCGTTQIDDKIIRSASYNNMNRTVTGASRRLLLALKAFVRPRKSIRPKIRYCHSTVGNSLKASIMATLLSHRFYFLL